MGDTTLGSLGELAVAIFVVFFFAGEIAPILPLLLRVTGEVESVVDRLGGEMPAPMAALLCVFVVFPDAVSMRTGDPGLRAGDTDLRAGDTALRVGEPNLDEGVFLAGDVDFFLCGTIPPDACL